MSLNFDHTHSQHNTNVSANWEDRISWDELQINHNLDVNRVLEIAFNTYIQNDNITSNTFI